MQDNKNDVNIVSVEMFDNILVSYSLMHEAEGRRALETLVGQPLNGWAGVVQVDVDEFLTYKKYAVSNNAILYLLSLTDSQGELLDAEAFLLRAELNDGLVIKLKDLKTDKEEEFNMLWW